MSSNIPSFNSQLGKSDTNDESCEDIVQLPLKQSDRFYLQGYVMFENKSNNCWLNSALALLLHNKTLNCTLKSKNDTVLVKILQLFRSVMVFVNDSTKSAEKRKAVVSVKLNIIQELAIAYLQPLIKCENGKPDSAFNAVMNLIGSDPRALNLFVTSFSRSLECENCKTVRLREHKKTVITLTSVESFDGANPFSFCDCSACKVPKQKMFLHYQSLPPCLLFHFENGAGEGVLDQTEFVVGARRYHLSGVVTLEKSGPIHHFITWIRNPDLDQWLEYNDLGPMVSVFKDLNPRISLDSIHMLSFEALDQMGVITNFNGLVSTNQMFGNSCNYAEIPEITISDDNDTDCTGQDLHKSNTSLINKSFSEMPHKHLFQNYPMQSTSRMDSSTSAVGNATTTLTSSEKFFEKKNILLNETSSSPQKVIGDKRGFPASPQISPANKKKKHADCKGLDSEEIEIMYGAIKEHKVESESNVKTNQEFKSPKLLNKDKRHNFSQKCKSPETKSTNAGKRSVDKDYNVASNKNDTGNFQTKSNEGTKLIAQRGDKVSKGNVKHSQSTQAVVLRKEQEMTTYEERLLNMAVDDFLLNQIFPYFGIKDD